jgi:hypothetical protein
MKNLLENEGKVDDEEEEEEQVPEDNNDLSIVEEQAKLKRDFLKAANEESDDDDFLKLRFKFYVKFNSFYCELQSLCFHLYYK